jgi:formiminotetrahydrofolate cyclodeaminase
MTMLRDLSFIGLLEEISSNSPAPGGGSAAAIAGAVGCSLLMMVSGLTIGKKKYADVQEQVQQVLDEAGKLRAQFINLIDEDTDAFTRLFELFKIKEPTEEQKLELKAAEEGAINVPRKTMETALAAMEQAAKLAPIGNKNAISDVGVAVHFIKTAYKGGKLNVKINLAGKDEAAKAPYMKWLDEIGDRFSPVKKAAMTAVNERME